MFWSIIGIVILVAVAFWVVNIALNLILWLFIAIGGVIGAVVGWFVRKRDRS